MIGPIFQKYIAVFLILVFLGVQLLIPINTARAGDFGGSYALVTKEYVLDPLLKIVTGILVRGITNYIISWITGNGGKNVGFVGNLEAEFRRQIDARGGEFLNNLVGIDLCTADLKAALQIKLQVPTGLRDKLECTVSGIVGNAEGFLNDFKQGGLPAFVSVTTQAQNNPYGAYLIALDAKIRTESSVHQSEKTVFTANSGFFGTRSYDVKCETLSPEDKDSVEIGGGSLTPDKYCGAGKTHRLEYNTKTPGGAVADMLNRTFGSGLDWGIVADEIGEAINAIINALIYKVVDFSFSGSQDSDDTDGLAGGGGLSDNPELGQLVYRPDLTEIKDKLLTLIDNAIVQGEAALLTDIDEEYRIKIEESLKRLRSLREQVVATDDPVVLLSLAREVITEVRSLIAIIQAAGLGSILTGIQAIIDAINALELIVNVTVVAP